MAKKVFKWETKSGRKGFIQEEGVFFTKWVVYEEGKRLFGLGSEKIGELRPDLKSDELLKELERLLEEKVKIWKVWFLRRVYPSYFLLYKNFKIIFSACNFLSLIS